MLKIAICDDELIFAEKLKKIITDYMIRRQIEFEIVLFDSGDSFTGLGMEMSRFRILFLDINMKGMDGMQTAARLREYCRDTYLVFVTAFMEYTLEGYKVEAIRYILKNTPRFAHAVQESLDTICEKMNYSAEIRSFEFKEGVRKLPLDRIVYIETEVHALVFHVLEQDYVCYHLRDTLSNMEAQLAEHGFWRIHQSYLVNRKYSVKLSAYCLQLVNAESLPVAKQRFRSVREQFALYKGEM